MRMFSLVLTLCLIVVGTAMADSRVTPDRMYTFHEYPVIELKSEAEHVRDMEREIEELRKRIVALEKDKLELKSLYPECENIKKPTITDSIYKCEKRPAQEGK